MVRIPCLLPDIGGPDSPEVLINASGVTLGGVLVPALVIEHGVTVKPGGDDDITTITVTFFAGTIDIDDAVLKHVTIDRSK